MAPFAKRARWRERFAARLIDRVPALLCAALLIPGTRNWWPPLLSARFIPEGAAAPWLGAALVAGALGFAVWARFQLGRNWSDRVAVKEDHVLITSGPYAIVRHPIYSGLLLALVGTALAVGEWRSLLAVGAAAIFILRRVGIEERRMAETFAEYEAYRRTTPALFPRWRRH